MPVDKLFNLTHTVGSDSDSNDKWWMKFRNDESKSKLIMCGLAAGVSAGFMSPMGGICFVLEEAQTFWSVHMTAGVRHHLV